MNPSSQFRPRRLALLAACAGNPWTVDRFEAPEADVAGRTTFLYKPGEVEPAGTATRTCARTEAQVREVIVGDCSARATSRRAARLAPTWSSPTRHPACAASWNRPAAHRRTFAEPGADAWLDARRPASDCHREVRSRVSDSGSSRSGHGHADLARAGKRRAAHRFAGGRGAPGHDMTRHIMQQFPARRAKQ